MSDWQPGTSLEALKKRAALLKKTRDFFYERNVLEVETPILSKYPAFDLHLTHFKTKSSSGLRECFLSSSPEYHMKRLLAAGAPSIYQICKAFRDNETGEKHNPEFTILEWYRLDWNHFQLMREVEELLDVLIGSGSSDSLTYHELFMKYLGIDPLSLNKDNFLDLCRENNLTPPENLICSAKSNEECLDYLMALVIEPQLGLNRPLFVHGFPENQCLLAKIDQSNPKIAQRFEIYYKGLEIGNGYNELTNAKALKKRFEKINQLRINRGKTKVLLDQYLLAAMERGMPECAGVALGFDRILMLSQQKDSISKVIAFSQLRS